MVYSYIRISTDKQTVENQRFEIQSYATQKNIRINKWIEETISSKKLLADRKLGALLQTIESQDTIIVSEISRLGRNLMQIMGILNLCMEKKNQNNFHQGKLRTRRQHKLEGFGIRIRSVGGNRAQPHLPAHKRGARKKKS